jgi:hypothetical protein
MKRAVQLLTCALVSALTTHAQTAAPAVNPPAQPQPVKQAIHQLEAMQERLIDLSQEQVISINSILLDENILLDSLHEHPTGDPKADGQLRHNILHDADVHIYSLLNENQQVQYVLWKQEQRIKNLEKYKQKMQAAADSTSQQPH